MKYPYLMIAKYNNKSWTLIILSPVVPHAETGEPGDKAMFIRDAAVAIGKDFDLEFVQYMTWGATENAIYLAEHAKTIVVSLANQLM